MGVLIATVDGSIVIISLPAIFRGIGLDPLAPGNIGYLLWMILGYLLVTAVLVVALGRLGDMFGRVRMYNLGFVIFSELVARHGVIGGRVETRVERRDITGHDHRVDVGVGDEQAVHDIGAGGADRDRRVGGHQQTLRRERVLLRDEAHDHRAVRLHRAAEIVLGEFAGKL
ncbi:MAG TPA: hypothetical protein VHZ97_20325, partial [Pseudonocardiaceae bacterium]|nr:hypothetical protein [Pseudonocardiaceae bacterium]